MGLGRTAFDIGILNVLEVVEEGFQFDFEGLKLGIIQFEAGELGNVTNLIQSERHGHDSNPTVEGREGKDSPARDAKRIRP